MEDWLYYSLSIALCGLAISFLVVSLRPATGKKPAAAATPSLPPGPTALTAALGPLLLLAWTSVNIESAVRAARSWYGPVFTVHLRPSSPVVFVLVRRGAAFADRPPPTLATRIFSSDGRSITTCAYGPLWRLLRRNLTGKILRPSSVRRYAAARRSAARGLVAGITTQMLQRGEGEAAAAGPGVVVLDDLLHRAVFHVLISMCFGVGLDDGAAASVASLQKELLSTAVGFQVFGARPSALTKLLFRRRYEKMLSIRRRHEDLFVPLIRARSRARHAGAGAATDNDDDVACYVDSLLDLTVSEGDVDGGGVRTNRQLTEGELVSLCTEFLSGGADSTITALQWTMANVIARPEIQAKLRAEIRHVVAGAGTQQQQLDDDEHLPQMPYLRAVVLESLRRHPPGRFMVPRAATEEGGATLVHGFRVPRHVPVNFTLGDMAMDEAVWPDPQRFRPERFLPGGEGQDVDLTGSSGEMIKMMPFGAGRRMCPGVDVSLLHLQWFVATMVREFEWKEVPGEPVDLFAEKLVLTMVMARPLRAMVMRCSQI